MISVESIVPSPGAVMKSQVSMSKSMIVAVALAAATSGIARADDSSVGRFGSDGYAYFNMPRFDRAPSGFRLSNPNGLSESQYQAMSSEASAWHAAPAFARTRATFRQMNPNGLSESQYQGLSSEAPAWHSQPSAPTSTRPPGSVSTAEK
jgi:hypothetical protein